MKKLTKHQLSFYDKMTPLQREYCNEFLACGSKSGAYRNACKNLDIVAATRAREASQVLSKRKNVAAFLLSFRNEGYRKTLKDILGSREEKRELLLTIVQLKIDHAKRIFDKGLTCSMTDAISAIAELNKMDGDTAPRQMEITGRLGGPIELKPWEVEVVKPVCLE